MTNVLRSDVNTQMPADRNGLQLFVDGCYEPGSGHGGWAFVAYRNGVEIAFDRGGADNAGNNVMEVTALLKAMAWIDGNAAGEPAVIWSDSRHAVKGCNHLRPIWRSNGWKKADPNPKARRRTIADPDLWKAIDLQLSQNHQMTVAWCKGHFGIDGNERADELAEQGRLFIRRPQPQG